MFRTTRVIIVGMLATALMMAVSAKPAFADAWGASWGQLSATVSVGSGNIVWNTNPEDWLVHAEGDVRHNHPPISSNYGCDTEGWGPGGDGVASISNIATGDLARVLSVSAGVAGTGGSAPFVDMSADKNVYSEAHDNPASYSDASGLGQHDNLFSITGGVGSTLVTITLQGTWNLAGHSDPDDNWWADWFAFGEIYEASNGDTLASDSFYRYLSGPGDKADGGSVTLQLTKELLYGKSYSLRFFVDLESHAQAQPIPAPSAAALMAGGLIMLAAWSLGGRRGRKAPHTA